MPKCDFNKVAKQLYLNRTSTCVFSYKFAAYFQTTFCMEHLWVTVSGNSTGTVHRFPISNVFFKTYKRVNILNLIGLDFILLGEVDHIFGKVRSLYSSD